MGITFLILFFSAPLIYSYLKKRNKLEFILEKLDKPIRRYENFFILFYISAFISFASLFGSIYPSVATLTKEYWYRIFETLVLVGEASLVLILPLTIATLVLDKIIKKFSAYLFLEQGLLDPVIDEQNIALRNQSFLEIINGIEDNKVSEIADKIGSEYAKRILTYHTNISSLNNFKDKWLETDIKAGLLENISINANHIEIISPLLNGDDKIYSFMQSYCKTIIETYYRNVVIGTQNIEMITNPEQKKLLFLISNFSE